MAKKSKSYEAIRELTIGDDLVIPVGEVTDQIPQKSVQWLLDQGHIREVKEWAEDGDPR